MGTADQVGLAPALWQHGVRSGWWYPVPDDAAELIRRLSPDAYGQPELALQAAFADNSERIDDLLRQGESLEAHFTAAGLPAVRLKGWHTITAGWWPDSAERTMTDVDVLVPADRVEDGAEILRDMGYRPIASGHTALADHEMPPVHLPGHAGSVEIHRALLLERWARVLPAGDVLAAGAPMSTTDAVTHLIAHAQLQDEAYLLCRVPWRALYELTMLLRTERCADVDWATVRERFVGVDAERALDGFLSLSSRLFGADVPQNGSGLPLRSRLALAAVDRPRYGAALSWLAYLPRAFSADQMRSVDPDHSPWVTRFVEVGRAIRSRVRAGGSGAR